MYRLEADCYTVIVLSDEVALKCSSLIDDSNAAYIGNSNSSQGQTEQAVQYYCASSIVLTLDGYNNSAVLGPEDALNDEHPNGIDTALLDCRNNTIREAAPLADDDISLAPDPHTHWVKTTFILRRLLKCGAHFWGTMPVYATPYQRPYIPR